jgi:hypothetical protein
MAATGITSEPEKLVDANTLLSLLWDEASRPSLRWLREQQARRTIPFVKLGARVWFSPGDVRRHLGQKWTFGRK